MIAFCTVLINNFKRILEHKSRVILILIMITGAVTAAVFFDSMVSDSVGNIAFVSQGNEGGFSSPYLNVTQLETAPPLSDLVLGRYDAVVINIGKREYNIQTIKSDDFKQTVAAILSNPSDYHPDMSSRRKAGTNIVGFLTMFILMQGTTMMLFFAEDREHGQIKRVAASPVSFIGYLCAHCLFTFLLLLIPTMVMLYLVKFVLGANIGFGFPEYLLLITIICALSTSFALFLNAFINKSDSANMLGSMVSILTSILAGSFYSFDKGNRVLETLIKVLPQKSYLTLAGRLENGSELNELLPQLVYLSVLILFFFLVAAIKTRKNYVKS